MPRSRTSSSIQEQVDVLDDSDVWVNSTAHGAAAAAADSSASSNSAAAAAFTENNNTVGHALRDLEEQLRCGICCNFFQSPVLVVPCSHTFCSLCVRSKFKANQNSTARKVSCPACNEGVDTSGVEFSKCLVPNRAVHNLVEQFRLLRQPLLSHLRQQQQQTASNVPEVDATSSSAADHDDAPQQPPNGEGEQQERPRRSARCAEAKENKTKDDKVASESADKMEEEDSKPAAAAATGNNQPRVAEQPQVAELSPELEQRRKKLPRAIYKGLKKKDLQALCRKHRLPESGSEKDLKERHSAWIDKYNAECDSFLPRSVEDLRKELVNEECDKKVAALASGKELARVAKLFANLTRLGKAEANWTGIPSSGDKKFDELLVSIFDKLIVSHRARFPELDIRRRSLAEIEAVMADKEQQRALAPAQRNAKSGENAHMPVGRQIAAAKEDEGMAPSNDAAAKKSNPPAVLGRAANPSDDSAKIDKSGVNNPYAAFFKSAAPAPKNPYTQGKSSNGSTSSIDNHASALQQNFDNASNDSGVSAGSRGTKMPRASVASDALKPAPANSNLSKEGRNATGLTVSFGSETSHSAPGLFSAKNQAQGHFFGSHLRTQQSGSQPPSQHQSVGSSSSNENSLSRQGVHAAAKATKRKSPKQSQLNLAFTSKPKKQRSLNERKKPAEERGSSNSLFGPSWKCTFCVSDNEMNPGSRAKCSTCGGCRQCRLCPCICSESSSQETLSIDC